MDPLDDYLSGLRARGALFARSICAPPWSMRFSEPAPLTLATMLRGAAWIVPAEGRPVRLGEGDVVLLRGTRPFTVADRPGVPPRVVIDGNDLCRGTDEAPAAAGDHFRLGTRTYGFSADGPDVLVTAAYRARGAVCGRLLEVLPEVAVVRREPEFAPLADLIAGEIVLDEPGQQTVLDRLLDLLLVRVLRSWFGRPEARPPAGYHALGDPRIGHVLRLLHRRPARPWTVATLAAEAGMSRAAFARRFTALVGRPPLGYLTDWRMALAADLLRESAATVAEVARQVGYTDPFTFSAAFKRVRGTAPSALRRDRADIPSAVR
ncbi:AraC family transcriptional regulator [Nonomuraea sp. NPDC046570]|uniref:AraC family transcriptional regulator n=1 Tax=Nonomuraea sp. NPDC046570 TaxID=3155255 RepID=UPI00340E295B